jgi:hypothetical protein
LKTSHIAIRALVRIDKAYAELNGFVLECVRRALDPKDGCSWRNVKYRRDVFISRARAQILFHPND